MCKQMSAPGREIVKQIRAKVCLVDRWTRLCWRGAALKKLTRLVENRGSRSKEKRNVNVRARHVCAHSDLWCPAGALYLLPPTTHRTGSPGESAPYPPRPPDPSPDLERNQPAQPKTPDEARADLFAPPQPLPGPGSGAAGGNGLHRPPRAGSPSPGRRRHRSGQSSRRPCVFTELTPAVGGSWTRALWSGGDR